jgi:hypothetical protein
MSLKEKWHLKEIARYLLSIPFSFTALLLMMIAFRMMNFHDQGLAMYPDLRIPKTFPLGYALDTFWCLSLAPLLPGFLLTLPIDALVRRYALHLNQS